MLLGLVAVWYAVISFDVSGPGSVDLYRYTCQGALFTAWDESTAKQGIRPFEGAIAPVGIEVPCRDEARSRLTWSGVLVAIAAGIAATIRLHRSPSRSTGEPTADA